MYGREFFTFAFVGLICTVVHGIILVTLVELCMLPPPLANSLAFLNANIVSFVLNSKYTFKKSVSFFGYFRFLYASFIAFVLTVCISYLMNVYHVNYLAVFITTVTTVPIVSFLAIRFFGYSKSSSK